MVHLGTVSFARSGGSVAPARSLPESATGTGRRPWPARAAGAYHRTRPSRDTTTVSIVIPRTITKVRFEAPDPRPRAS